MYKKVSTDMNFVGREKEVEAFWKEHDIFQKSMEEKEGCPEYTLRRTSDSKRKTAYRSRSDTCYQRYDPEIPHNEGIQGSS